LIQKFDGHHAEVWALATSNRGDFVVTGSHDKSLRVWEKTDEPLFLEEEREREMEQLYDNNLVNELQTSAEGEDGEEVEAVTKTTSESMMAGERIMEAIELADADLAATKAYEEEKVKMGEMGGSLPKPTRHPELATKGDITPVAFVMGVLRKIPAASMEDALLVLPFRQVVSLLGYLDEWALAVSLPPLPLVNDTHIQNRDIILVSRLLYFLLRTHASQISSSRTLRPQLIQLRQHLRTALDKERQTMGFNLAAMKYLKSRWESDKVISIEDVDDVKGRMGKDIKKRKRIDIKA
jgi:U3 small nucleolar RNA-associated protein 12